MLQYTTINHDQGMNWYKKLNHSHHEYHLYLITYGSCIFRTSDQEIVANKGDVILTPQQCTVEEYTPERALHQKFSIHFKVTTAFYNQLPMLQTNLIIHSISGLFDRAHDQLRPIWKEISEEQDYSEIRLSAFLLDMLAMWQRELDRGELAPASVIHIIRMKSYIQSHYREHISKEDLGAYIRRSPNYAANLFKKGTGQTISAYVHNIRMKTALYMLSESLLTITEISEYLGYSDVSYFQRIFKRTFGKPASQYLDDRRHA